MWLDYIQKVIKIRESSVMSLRGIMISLPTIVYQRKCLDNKPKWNYSRFVL